MTPLRYLATMDDGLEILIRNVMPHDRLAIQTGVGMLSHRSRYFRFLNGKSHLTESQLDQLTNIDNVNHVGLFAMSSYSIFWQRFGVARFIRNQEKFNSAEVAIALLDEYHGKGLGSLLLDILMVLAVERGIIEFSGLVLPENKRMIRILQRRNAQFNILPGPVYEVKLSIPESIHLPENVAPVECGVEELVG